MKVHITTGYSGDVDFHFLDLEQKAFSCTKRSWDNLRQPVNTERQRWMFLGLCSIKMVKSMLFSLKGALIKDKVVNTFNQPKDNTTGWSDFGTYKPKHIRNQEFNIWTRVRGFRHAGMAGSLPEHYLACQQVNGSNQGVYTGGLRPGRLLPLCTVAGGVSASLQGNRKQVETRE